MTVNHLPHTVFINQTLKQCTTCKEHKSIDCFYKKTKSKDGVDSWCKECVSKKSKIYYLENKEKVIKKTNNYYHINKNKPQNREKSRISLKKWRENNKNKWREQVKKYKALNPEKQKEYKKTANFNARSTPKGKLNTNISNSIRQSINNGSKAGRRWECLVGYTVDQLKRHLEKQFTPEMNWDNYGSYWWIDHKIPISAHNFENPEDKDFKKCWSLKNLTPLEKIENIKKSNKLLKPFQPSLKGF